ncbi:hypothetical protein VNO77_27555 [Canavalia gladiata]|uniref:Uncharacterized protein n=1 Tax=Canavalia gladiata TaxID=3824 RepID=A0AAN9KVG8_CANGL
MLGLMMLQAQRGYDYLWTHALNSDQTHELIQKYCDFTSENVTAICVNATRKASIEKGNIDFYNIYAPLCQDSSLKNGPIGSLYDFDPCSDYYGEAYLNRPEVQLALHAKPTNWSHCRVQQIGPRVQQIENCREGERGK